MLLRPIVSSESALPIAVVASALGVLHRHSEMYVVRGSVVDTYLVCIESVDGEIIAPEWGMVLEFLIDDDGFTSPIRIIRIQAGITVIQ